MTTSHCQRAWPRMRLWFSCSYRLCVEGRWAWSTCSLILTLRRDRVAIDCAASPNRGRPASAQPSSDRWRGFGPLQPNATCTRAGDAPGRPLADFLRSTRAGSLQTESSALELNVGLKRESCSTSKSQSEVHVPGRKPQRFHQERSRSSEALADGSRPTYR